MNLAYRDDVVRARAARRIRELIARAHAASGIRLVDVGATAVVAVVVELNIAVASGPGQAPLDAFAYVLGAVLVLPILFRTRRPLQVLIACSVLLFIYYSFHHRNISPAPLLSLPLYDAALAGYMAWAIVIPAVYMVVGLFVVGAATHLGLLTLTAAFLPSVVVLGLAILLGDVVRSRRALAIETAQRLRVAEEEREAEAARRVAEERLRIARELHDTVAHSMATITVQAGSALHVLAADEASAGQVSAGQVGADQVSAGQVGAGQVSAGEDAADRDGSRLVGGHREQIRTALTAIRDTSKGALAEMRTTLGQMRNGDSIQRPGAAQGGLDRLQALRDAVEAAGLPVSLTIEGDAVALPEQIDHAAYRILQESLTNVLKHAGSSATAQVRLRYQPCTLTLEVLDDGTGPSPRPDRHPGGGHGLAGMRERAESVRGDLVARPRQGGGFEVVAHLPLEETRLPAGETRLPVTGSGAAPTREAVKRLIS